MIRTCEVGKYYKIRNKHSSLVVGVFKCTDRTLGSDEEAYFHFEEYSVAADEYHSSWQFEEATELEKALW
jgi:hypothetical protein